MTKTLQELQEERRVRFFEKYKQAFGEYPKELTPKEKAEREANTVIVYNVYGVKSNWL